MLRRSARRWGPVTPSLRPPFVLTILNLRVPLKPGSVRTVPGFDVLAARRRGGHRADLHAERKAHVLEAVLDLVERLLAEVLDGQEFLVALADQLADGLDAGDLQAVGGARRKLDHLDRLAQDLLELGVDGHAAQLAGAFGSLAETAAFLRLRLLFLGDEDVEGLAQELGGLNERLGRVERAIGPDLEDQAVIVRDLADASVLDVVVHLGDGREERVDRQEARRPVALGAKLLGRDVAAALGDLDLHVELAARFQVRDDEIAVDDLDVRVALDRGRLDRAFLVGRQVHGLGTVGEELDAQLLEVEEDVHDIFLHAVDRGVLVRGLLDAHGRHGRALEAGEKNAAQRVAHGVAVAALVGLRHELGVAVRHRLLVDAEFLRQDQFFISHDVSLSAELLRIVLDDELLGDREGHLAALRRAGDLARQLLLVELDEAGPVVEALGRIEAELDADVLLEFGRQRDRMAGLDRERRD